MTPEEMEFIRQSIASHDRQIGDMVDRQAELDKRFDRVATMQKENARLIRRNARMIRANGKHIEANSNEIKVALDIMVATVGKVALLIDNHERRIQGLEEPPTQ
jgi:hypothetical protein